MVLRRLALPLALALLLPAPLPAEDLEGVVRMPRVDYDRLKDAAEKAQEAPARKLAVVPPSVESAAYELRVSPDRIALELTADVVVKPSAAESRVTLPPAGLLDSLTDKGPAVVGVVAEGGRLALVFSKPGRYRIGARFLPPETRAEGQRSVDFTVMPAAAARLAGFGSDTLAVAVSGGPQEPLAPGAARPLPASALVHAVVRAPARIAAPSEKPLVLCDTVDVLRVERDRVTQRIFVRVSVTRAPLAELVLATEKGAEVASLTGPSDPAFSLKDDGRIVISPASPINGDAAFSLLLTRPAPGEGARVDLVPTRVEGAASSRSYVLVDPNPLRTQETVKEATSALSRVDVEDLPAVALPFASAGTRAYRVTGATAHLALAAPARAVVPLPDTLLVDAELLTVLGDGGSRLDRRRYVFETKLPHLDVPVPDGEEVLAVAVDGIPATPRVDGKALVVSLPPSAAPRRVVEVSSKSAATVPKKRGEITLTQRPLPAVASLARWTIVLPEDRRYRVGKAEGIGRVAWAKDAPAAVSHVEVRRQSWGAPEAAPQAPAARNMAVGSETAPSAGGSSSLNVVVTDTSNAPLPGVTVELKGPSVQGSRVVVTDASGRGFFPNLPAGRYTAVASLAGFSRVEKGATLTPGSGALVPLTMSISSVKEEVVVTGEAPVIDVTKTTLGTTVNMDQTPRGKGVDLSGLFRKKKKPEPAPENAYVSGGVEGGVAGGVMGGVLAAPAGVEEPRRVGDLSEKTQAGTRSLAMEVSGRGKRLLLSGPIVGALPFAVTLEVKPE